MAESSNAKIPPNSKESEMIVLGCMLTSIGSLNIAADMLQDTDFYYSEHRIIFEVLKSCFLQDKPADVHLVAEELKRREQLKNIGGVAYLTSLAQYAGTAAHIEEYTELVRNKSLLRRMIQSAQSVEKLAFDDPEDVTTTLDVAQQKFFQISQAANTAAGIQIRDLLSGAKATSKLSYLKELQERQELFQTRGPGEGTTTGIPTHFNDLDKLINGLSPSNLMILAARPAMGKTALALNIAENVCFKNNLPVGIFSLEMTADQLLHRIICSQAEVESDKIRTGAINGIEFQRIVSSVGNMQKHTMIIDDSPGLKITDLRARARRMREAHGIEFLVIDYLQLLSGSGASRNQENRQMEVSEISRLLKTLARELNIPILCLSQLSRKVEERAGHRPMMSDLRESGCLTGDTEIKDAETGKIYTIKDLAERKVQTPIMVYGVDKELKMGKHKMVKAFYSGKKTVYEMKTRTGRTIKASANHPFLKLEGWTRLDALTPGDRIGLPRNLMDKRDSKVSSDELVLLAHLLGDGCILPSQPYHYTSADEENIEAVSSTSKRLFNIQSRVVRQKNWFHVYLPSPYRLTHNKYHPITSWFNHLGIDRVRSYDKQIPSSVFESNADDTALFLKHLWATDGNISLKTMIGRKPSAAIYYASSSPTLSKQTQHLLLTLGIQSTVAKVHSNRGYRPMYHVNIQGSNNQKQFLEKVGCAGKRGAIIPQLLEQIKHIEPHLNYDVIPKEAWQTVVKKAKEEFKLGWREVCKGLNTSYCGSTLFKAGISRTRMKTLLNILPSKELETLAKSDIYWDEIMSITKLSVEDVYDATVEDVHNFVANDIVVHNSIEQDSDLVMFLLRREYYDPYDKPGTAELIVAKNRHGAIGNINFAFRKEIAQFADLSPIRQGGAPDNSEAFSAFSPSK
jgi:replicative DNA helicase